MFLDVNGKRMQTGSTSTMIFTCAHILHYVSQFMVLEAGDVITTGTPPGVGLGMKPPVLPQSRRRHDARHRRPRPAAAEGRALQDVRPAAGKSGSLVLSPLLLGPGSRALVPLGMARRKPPFGGPGISRASDQYPPATALHGNPAFLQNDRALGWLDTPA